MMKKWTGWLVRKQYFKVEVEADTWEEAKDLVGDAEVDTDEPDDVDWDIYDVEEEEDENNNSCEPT
jgi:hypothetical protein